MDKSASRPESRGCASLISSSKHSTKIVPTVIHHAHAISVDLSKKEKQDTHDGVSCFFHPTDFPPTKGVVEFIAHDRSTILLAATGNIRAFIAQRFTEPTNQPKANLAPITARIIAYPTGSGFESHWILHQRARSVDPNLSTKLNEQNRMAMLVLDPRLGTWSLQDTLSFVPSDHQSHQVLIAPIRTHKAARALGEALDDVFELCRFPKELAKAPDGTACAYKEMGRCPGACEGAESIEAYADRFDQATEIACAGIERWKSALRSQIQHASDELDFEHARMTQRQLEQVNKLPTDALEHARTLAGLCCVCITPAVRKGWAMIWIFGNQGLIPLAAADEDAGDLQSMIECWQSPIGTTPAELDQLALVARFWLSKPSRARHRRVTILDLREAGWQEKIAPAIAQACVPADSAQGDEEQTHMMR